MRYLTILPALLLALQLCGQALAEDYPASSQLAIRAGEVVAETIQAQQQLESLLDISPLEVQMAMAAASFRDLQQRLAPFGDPVLWSTDRLLDTRRLLVRERLKMQAVMQAIASRQEGVDALRQEWTARQRFWLGWARSLADEEGQRAQAVFNNVQHSIEQLLVMAERGSAGLLRLQEQQARTHNEALEFLVRVEAGLQQTRGRLFQRGGPPLLSPEFFAQLDDGLRREMQTGIRAALDVDLRSMQGQSWILFIQVLVFVVVATFIRRHQRRAEEDREWSFILSHPWATGIFVSMAALAPLYAAPPALWRLTVWMLFAFSAALLISGLVHNPLKRFTVFLLATVLLASMVLQLIELPVPLYRLYVTTIALGGLPLALLLARYNTTRHQGVIRPFTLGLRFAALVCLIIVLAQLAGYEALAATLLDASIKSVFIGIFALMTIRLGAGGIDFLLAQPLLQQRPFIQQYGDELGGRLKNILVVLVWVGALLNILFVLGVYDSFGHAMEELAGLGIFVGQVQLTLPMLLLGLLVIFLSLQVSWVLRATLDTQVFPYSTVDRGVRDAIKKLLHYFLVFIGFLLAMGLAGIELSNFAVLAGAFGIGIGFGLQNIVNNFVSGLILLFERPVKVGDMVVVDGEWGRVLSIGLRSTVIETFDGSELIVPNSQLISEKVTNWTLTTTRARVVMPVGVAYGSDLALVLRILQEAAGSQPLVLPEPAPSAIFVGFGDSSLDFELRCWIADVSMRLLVRSELGQFIDRRFREEGVEIPFPQRDLHLRSVDGGILGQVRTETPAP
jgi:potassium-dependent mechanosensitive channel